MSEDKERIVSAQRLSTDDGQFSRRRQSAPLNTG